MRHISHSHCLLCYMYATYTVYTCALTIKEKSLLFACQPSRLSRKQKKTWRGSWFHASHQYFLTYINNILISCYVPYIVTSIYMWYSLSDKGIFTLVKLRIAVQSPSKRSDKMFSETKKFACISIENIILIQIDIWNNFFFANLITVLNGDGMRLPISDIDAYWWRTMKHTCNFSENHTIISCYTTNSYLTWLEEQLQ